LYPPAMTQNKRGGVKEWGLQGLSEGKRYLIFFLTFRGGGGEGGLLKGKKEGPKIQAANVRPYWGNGERGDSSPTSHAKVEGGSKKKKEEDQ